MPPEQTGGNRAPIVEARRNGTLTIEMPEPLRNPGFSPRRRAINHSTRSPADRWGAHGTGLHS